MSIFEKQRFEIWNQSQHPYKHTLADFGYANPALPNVTNVESAINWILAVLYPNTKPAVATVAALPSSGNTLNDYRVVLDDGDGKAAAYRWEQREGEVSASWHKIYDMDWGQDSILAAFINNTQDIYVWRDGRDQLDVSGSVITGIYGGQTIYGGATANKNLTLKANSGDGVGASTGFVQIDDNARPAQDDTWALGTVSFRFTDLFLSNSAHIDTLDISTGSITDSTGAISFGNENLTTTGNFSGAIVTGTTSVKAGTATLASGSLTDTSGAISFDNENLITTGTLGSGVLTVTDNGATMVFDPDVTGQARITVSSSTLSFTNTNLTTTGSITGGALTGTQLDVDNLRLDTNTLSSTNTNGSIILLPNGTGVVDVQKAMTTLGITATGNLSVTGTSTLGSLLLSGNTVSSGTNADLNLVGNGTGNITFDSSFIPTVTNTVDIGTASLLLKTLFIATSLNDGTNSMTIPSLMTLRNANFRDAARTTAAANGDTLFYDSTSGTWLASHPDSEITHSELTGLTTGDSGHTQFALLAGRPGGQSLIGGTASSELLTLESTSNATKGTVQTKDSFLPFTTATFSGSWSGLDLGSSAKSYRDVYTKGQFFGLRVENYTLATIPASSAQNPGRLTYATDTAKLYVDTGAAQTIISYSKFQQDTSWNGTDTVKNVTISGLVDARTAQWQFLDNANNYEEIFAKIEKTSTTNVRITVNVALPAGSYRLIGIE